MNIDKKLDKVKPAQEKSGQPAGAHFSFLGMKRPGVSPPPSGWDASPQGYPHPLRNSPSFPNSLTGAIYSWAERGTVKVGFFVQEYNTLAIMSLIHVKPLPC